MLAPFIVQKINVQVQQTNMQAERAAAPASDVAQLLCCALNYVIIDVLVAPTA